MHMSPFRSFIRPQKMFMFAHVTITAEVQGRGCIGMIRSKMRNLCIMVVWMRAAAVIFSPAGIGFAQVPDDAPPSAPFVIVESIGLNVFINIAPVGNFTNYTEFLFLYC